MFLSYKKELISLLFNEYSITKKKNSHQSIFEVYSSNDINNVAENST